MTSNITCDYVPANWELNSRNETACQVYAQLQGQCDPLSANQAFIIQPVLQASPPYTPPADLCGCNVVAYNLMAGCAWCQLAIQDGWWLSVSQWAGNCTAAQFNPNSIPASVTTNNIVIPQWALVIPTGTTWDPAQASDIAAPPSSTSSTSASTPPRTSSLPHTSSLPSTTSSHTSSSSSSVDPFASTATTNVGQSVGIALGVILGLWALSTILVVVIYFSRQNQRKAWYAPMAAFYQARKGGYNGSGGGGHGQYAPITPHGTAGSAVPLVYPNPYHTSVSPSNATTVTTSAGAPTTSYQPPPPDASGFHPSAVAGYDGTPYVPPPPEPNYHGAQGAGGFPSGYNIPSRSAAWNGAGNTTSVYGGAGNTTSMYGPQTVPGAPGMGFGVPQGSPPGAEGGYRGHAEVH